MSSHSYDTLIKFPSLDEEKELKGATKIKSLAELDKLELEDLGPNILIGTLARIQDATAEYSGFPDLKNNIVTLNTWALRIKDIQSRSKSKNERKTSADTKEVKQEAKQSGVSHPENENEHVP